MMDRFLKECTLYSERTKPTVSFLNESIFPKISQKTPLAVTNPYRMLRINSLTDDFYSNLIDWSGENVFFAIDNAVYLHNFYSSKTTHIKTIANTVITSIRATSIRGNISLGTSMGVVMFLDLKSQKVSKYLHHKSRIGIIENEGRNVLTGSRDRKIKIIDTRSNKAMQTLSLHQQEVCGLSLNKDSKMLASGGNDNRLYIYDYRNLNVPLLKFTQHKAAVKALAWSPLSSNLIVSGGGTADKTIKLWDVSNNKSDSLVKSVGYGSQICNLRWLKTNKILSTHGYSKDDIRLSQMSSFKVEKYFYGHRNRVIHFSVSDDEKFFVSGSADSTMRFWQLKDENNDEINVR